MKNRFTAPALASLVLSLMAGPRLLAGESPSLPGLSSIHLPNGLEIIVYEDHSLPLARVNLAFKAGAIAQTADSGGHFHLLEHLLLDSPIDGSSFAAAMEALGATPWNGSTSAEMLSFGMKLSGADAAAAIVLWSKLAMVDSFSPEAVEAAKKQAREEIAASLENPDRVYEAAMTRRLFPKYPWRRDPAGSAASISKATPEGLSKLKATWLVPSNAALFVVGDVDTGAIFAAAKEAFSSWKTAPSPWKTPLAPQPKTGPSRPTWFALSDPSMPEGVALAEIRYRGPDLSTDAPASIAADLWGALVTRSGNRLQAALSKDVRGLRGEPPIVAYHVSQRDGGLLSVTASMDIDTKTPLLAKARAFKEGFRGDEMTAMRVDPSYFSAADFEAAKASLADARLRALDDMGTMVEELEFSWASASIDYFLSWPDRIKAMGSKEVMAFLDTWILHNLEVVALRLNPADYDRERANLEGGGFETARTSNSFWWQGR